MAADDDREPVPDPWDEIVAEGLGEDAKEVPFHFEEAAAGATGDASDDPSPPSAADGDQGPEGTDAAENALVDDWLSGSGSGLDAEAPPLSVFPPDESATGSSSVDIGTGTSGIALHGAPDQEEIGFEPPSGSTPDDQADALGWPAIDSSTGDVAGDQETGDSIGDFAIGAATAAGAASEAPARKVVRRPARPAKKAGIIGQVIGVALGGLLAFPIVGGILIGIVWMGGPDTMGLRKTPLAFLLPPKSPPASDGSAVPAANDADVAGGSALDNLPNVSEPMDPVPVVAVDEEAGLVPPDEPVPTDPVEPATSLADAEPADVGGDLVDVPPDPEPAPMTDVAVIDPPDLGPLGAIPAPTVPAEPPPLDTAALDQAVEHAEALGRALGLVEDRENKAYVKLRAEWYLALAHVAEELVALENAAATSGRPLAAAPDNVAALHGGISGQEALAAELAVAGPDWLAYEKRRGDGVVVPVTFASARKVGPYWTARVSLVDADGASRDLTIISRSEPAAIAGERVVVTGVALDGGVIWAADIRGAPGL